MWKTQTELFRFPKKGNCPGWNETHGSKANHTKWVTVKSGQLNLPVSFFLKANSIVCTGWPGQSSLCLQLSVLSGGPEGVSQNYAKAISTLAMYFLNII